MPAYDAARRAAPAGCAARRTCQRTPPRPRARRGGTTGPGARTPRPSGRPSRTRGSPRRARRRAAGRRPGRRRPATRPQPRRSSSGRGANQHHASSRTSATTVAMPIGVSQRPSPANGMKSRPHVRSRIRRGGRAGRPRPRTAKSRAAAGAPTRSGRRRRAPGAVAPGPARGWRRPARARRRG